LFDAEGIREMGAARLHSRQSLLATLGLLLLTCVAVHHPSASKYPSAPTAAPGLGITREGAAAIRLGMRLNEVEAVLGAPRGRNRMAAVSLDWDGPEAREWQQDFDNIMYDIDYLLRNTWYQQEWWAGSAGAVWVCLDEHGEVVAKSFIPARR
jgi:hypothetical protein